MYLSDIPPLDKPQMEICQAIRHCQTVAGIKGVMLGKVTVKQLKAEVRKAKRGLWADKEPVPPWEWRARKLE
jgi:hypothetical protein